MTLPAIRSVAGLCFLAFAAAAADKPGAPVRHTNRLAKESSPYLRQHAHNPVDWYPWGPEAFEKAKKENKLVFLSIGYSSCHWCHVMERESFASTDVARILNESFVCIKVDREERPDIDEIYMAALHVFDQRGGWPLSMFLTPDGQPIIGGTYWPPEDREIEGQTVKGFKSILKIMTDLKAKEPTRLTEQAAQVAKLTREQLGRARPRAPVALERALVHDGLEEIGRGFDDQHGGFGRKSGGFRGPKFPMPSYLELILAGLSRDRSDDLQRQLRVTLTKMATGGMFDHLGGGFHRYSTERTWTVPHFEKMLYDNAQLVEVYAKAFALDPKPLYEQTVRATLEFIRREMTAPHGGFYSALDADSDGEEGRFYVWSPRELQAALPDPADLALAREAYGVNAGPNFEDKASILTRRVSVDELLRASRLTAAQKEQAIDRVRARLLDARSRRARPFLDTKILTAWNGQMIAGFAEAGRVFKDEAYTAAARRAAEFILNNLRTPDGRLLRSHMTVEGKGAARLNAYLDDYAYLIHGLLALHRTTAEKRWLDEASALARVMVRQFRDEKDGGYFYTSHDHEKLFARSKDQYDGAEPSANSVAARDFVRLFRATGDSAWRDLARQSFETFSAALKAEPASLSTMLAALSEYLDITTPAETTPDDLKKPDAGKARRSDSVVKVAASAAAPDAAGKQVVTVTLEIDSGWYTYGNPIGNKDLEGAETVVSVGGKGRPKLIGVEYPRGTTKKETVMDTSIEYLIYEGKVAIKATVQRAAGDAEPLEVSVKFGACNKKGVCLLPVTVKVPLK